MRKASKSGRSDFPTTLTMPLAEGGKTCSSSPLSSQYSGNEPIPLTTMTGVTLSLAAKADEQSDSAIRMHSMRLIAFLSHLFFIGTISFLRFTPFQAWHNLP